MSKHTPGPWKYKQSDAAIISENGHTVARVHGISDGPTSEEQEEANARLIAAAPEMLEVCKLILKEWEAPTEGIQRGELIARLSQYAIEAREAIAKAEGRE